MTLWVIFKVEREHGDGVDRSYGGSGVGKGRAVKPCYPAEKRQRRRTAFFTASACQR